VVFGVIVIEVAATTFLASDTFAAVEVMETEDALELIVALVAVET
jgi:hypothetical protein